MSLMVLQDRCIGCGACDYSCHTDALTKTDSFLGTFEINPYTCDDCGVCVGKCPESAIVADDRFPVCNGHGCPLHSNRLAGTECAVWQEQCPSCGTTLWMEPDATEFRCPKCDMQRKVSCPRTRLIELIPPPTMKTV
jgi:ferredoxin